MAADPKRVGPGSREKVRDARDFDTTSLVPRGLHMKTLNRDFTAHFYRWSFARRVIKRTDHVLEVGCGVGQPLTDILFHGPAPRAASYTGVDLVPLKQRGGHLCTIIGEFNFVERWKELPLLDTRAITEQKRKGGDFLKYDVTVCLEVIEHMRVEHGLKMLKGIFALLRPDGALLLSTPVYDGARHAANHVHEYTVPELQKAVEKAGFRVERRFGTFMDVKYLKSMPDLEVRHAALELAAYFDNDALSCIFAPLFPDQARNNLWVLRKP